MELNELQKQVISSLEAKKNSLLEGIKMIKRAQPDGNYTKEQNCN